MGVEFELYTLLDIKDTGGPGFFLSEEVSTWLNFIFALSRRACYFQVIRDALDL